MASIRKKGLGYELRASCGCNSAGKRVRVSKILCPPDDLTTKQLEDWLQKQKILYDDEVKMHGQKPNSDLKFDAFVEIWWKNHATGLARKTNSVYAIYLPRLVQAFGHLRLSKISHIHINKFLENLREPGINKQLKKDEKGKFILDRKLSDRTIRDYYKLLNSILNKGVTWGYLAQNPGKFAMTPKLNYKEAAYLSEADTKRLLNLLNGENIKHKTMIYLLVYSGLRRAELLGLRWIDVDFDSQTITVAQSLQHFGPGDFEIKDPKSRAGKRQFTVSKSICDLLRAYKAWQNEMKEAAGDQWIDTGAVFTRENGTHCIPNSLSQWFRKFITRHGLPNITLHSLRHTHASLLIAEGVDLATISRRLGHSKISMTLDVYSHVMKSRDRKAAETLDKLLDINDDKLLKMTDFEHLRGKSGGNSKKSAENA